LLALGQGCLSVGPGTTFLTATFKEFGESLSVVLVLVSEDSRVHKGDEVRGALPRVFKVKAGATWDVCRGRDRERDMVGDKTRAGSEPAVGENGIPISFYETVVHANKGGFIPPITPSV
jgi:hypothetical protein